MARNRKYRAAAVRFGPALKAFLLCLLIGGTGVGYVWQKSLIADLGRQISQREKRSEDLRDANEKLRKQLATLRSPRFIEQRVKELNLGLGPAQLSQIIALPEPAGAQPAPARTEEVALENSGMMSEP